MNRPTPRTTRPACPDRSLSSNRARRAAAFTITELMVVVGIMVLLIGITFPFIGVLTGSSRVEAGLNIVGMSADVARQYVRPSQWASDSNNAVLHEQYNGTAALFCPTGEVRIVVNDRNAQKPGSGDYLEDSLSTPSPLATNGYQDLGDLDYLQIPTGAGVVGIHRDASGVRLIAPPFAVAFNENGQLNFGDTDGLIYYDGDNLGDYNIGRKRPANYNPSQWTGEEGSQNELDSTNLRHALRFEAIECVAGVLVYSEDAFSEQAALAADLNDDGVIDEGTAAWDWLRENGRTLFFSPQTGVALRDESDE